MAAATAQLAVNAFPEGLDHTQLRAIIYGVCTLSTGGTYVTNGIPLNWTATGTNPIEDGNFNNAVPFQGDWGPNQPQPQDAWFYTGASGLYNYWFDKVHNTLRIALGGVELLNAAAITADTIDFCAEFIKQGF